MGQDSLQTLAQSGYNNNKQEITEGKKAVGTYTTFKEFFEGGSFAYFMTADSNDVGQTDLFRFQFPLGQYLVTFDSNGTPINEVKSKLADIYARIKKNSGILK